MGEHGYNQFENLYGERIAVKTTSGEQLEGTLHRHYTFAQENFRGGVDVCETWIELTEVTRPGWCNLRKDPSPLVGVNTDEIESYELLDE